MTIIFKCYYNHPEVFVSSDYEIFILVDLYLYRAGYLDYHGDPIYNKNMNTTPEIMRHLTKELPLNDFGLPTGIYRSDLLPFHDYSTPVGSPVGESAATDVPPSTSKDAKTEDPQGLSGVSNADTDCQNTPVDPLSLLNGEGDGYDPIIQPSKPEPTTALTEVPEGEYRIAGFPAKALSSAFVPLQYDEGFPAFENGISFWERLSYEPVEAFQVFQRYTFMAQGTPTKEDEDEYTGTAARGNRSISDLVMQLYPTADDTKLLMMVDKFKEYYHLYYWGLRVKAYDLFRVTQYRQSQEVRALETQDDHYIQSRAMRHRLVQYMGSDEEFWDLMTPKVAIDMHKHLTQLERISAGVPAAGPTAHESENRGQTFEMAFRTFAQDQNNAALTEEGDTVSEDGEVLTRALQDPAATKVLQELIIRSGGG